MQGDLGAPVANLVGTVMAYASISAERHPICQVYSPGAFGLSGCRRRLTLAQETTGFFTILGGAPMPGICCSRPVTSAMA